MKSVFYIIVLSFALLGCNSEKDFSAIVPIEVDKFATRFISEVHNGNIDASMSMFHSDLNEANTETFLTNTFANIQAYSIDTFSIVNASKRTLLGENSSSIYTIDYEYKVDEKFLYFTLGIKEQGGELMITAFDGQILNDSLAAIHAFTFNGKGVVHYLFLLIALLIPLFILVSVFFVKNTTLNRKWLWMIGMLFGFMKFSINWTTGEIGLNFFSISFLGAGFTKLGHIAPWEVSFTFPIVAIAFWYKRYWNKKEKEAHKMLDELIEEGESQKIDL